jgi:hypothetical protein
MFVRELKLILLLTFVIPFGAYANDYFWVNGSGSWNDTNHWATTSGGAIKYSSLPDVDDDVHFDANSFSASGQTVTIYLDATCRNMDWTGVTNNPTFEGFFTDLYVYGSLIIPSSVQRQFTGNIHMMAASGSVDIDLDNIPISDPDYETLYFEGGATWNLLDDVTQNGIEITGGIFNTNNHNVTCSNFVISGTAAKTVNLGSSLIATEVWDATSEGLTFNVGTATISVSYDFYGAGLTYGDVTFTDNTISLTGSNTFNTVTLNANVVLEVEAGSVQTIADLVSNGIDIAPVTIKSSVEGSAATFSKASGSVTIEYARIQDNTAEGGATFTANNSVELGNVTGWTIPVIEPTVQTSSILTRKALINSVKFSWESGNGARRIVLAKQGSAVDSDPSDDIEYTAGSFGTGSEIGTGNFVVYASNGTAATISGLNPESTYYFKVFEFNGSGTDVDYLIASPPSVDITTLPSTAVIMSNDPVSACSGAYYESGGSYYYDNNEDFTQTLSPSSGGSKVKLAFNDFYLAGFDDMLTIYDGVSTSAPVLGSFYGSDTPDVVKATNAEGKLTLKFHSDAYGNSTGWVADISCFVFDDEPDASAYGLSASDIMGVRMTLAWNNGNGTRRVVIAKANAEVLSAPLDGTIYAASPNFGSGDALGTGEFVVYNGTGSQVNLTGLAYNTSYHFSIFEYNGDNTSINYQATGATAVFATNATEEEPTELSYLSDYSVLFNSIKLSWVNGNGDGRVVIAYTDNGWGSVSDGMDYEADSVFGQGSNVGSEAFVVYKGSAETSVEITGLETGTQYWFSIVEYNGTGAGSNYKSSYSFGLTTLKMKPTIAASNLVVSGITTSSMTLDWTQGNGDYSLVIAHAESPVSLDLRDSTWVYGNDVFGHGLDLGDGHTVVYSGWENSVTITGLSPSTTYYYTVISFNRPSVNGQEIPYFLLTGAPVKSGTTKAGKNYYWVNGTGNWSDYAHHWARTSGGSLFHSSVPTSADNVYFDQNSFSADSQKVIIDVEVATCLSMDWSDIDQKTFVETLEDEQQCNRPLEVYGSMILSPHVSFNVFYVYLKSTKSGNVLDFGPDRKFLSSCWSSITFDGYHGQWELQGDVQVNGLYFSRGHFVATDSRITADWIFLQEGTSGELGNSHLTFSGLQSWSDQADNINFQGGHATSYYSLHLNGTHFKTVTALSSLTLFGGGTLDSLKFEQPGSILTLESGKTFEINSINLPFDPQNDQVFSRIRASNPGVAATLQKNTGSINLNRVILQDNHATGGAFFNASNSVKDSNVSGWNVTIPPIVPPNQSSWYIGFEQVRHTDLGMNFGYGNGMKRIVVVKEGSPVDQTPADNMQIIASKSFGQGTDLGNGNFVVYDSSGNSTKVNQLSAGKTYYFSVFEYNTWNDSSAFNLDHGSAEVTMLREQDIYMTNESKETCDATYYDNGGKGQYNGADLIQTISSDDARLNMAVMFEESQVGWYYDTLLIFNGPDINSPLLMSLVYDDVPEEPIYSDNNSNSLTFWLKGESWSAGSGWRARLYCVGDLATEPLLQSGLSIIEKGENSLRVRASGGDGTGRLIIARKDQEVNKNPLDGLAYKANAVFGTGDDLGDGNFVVYSGTSKEVLVSALEPNTIYYFKAFEFKGAGNTANYLVTDEGATFDTTMIGEPEQPPLISVDPILKTFANVSIENGDGSGCVIFVKKGSPITVMPVDNTVYAPFNTGYPYKEGTLVGDSTYVFFVGTSQSIWLEGLQQNTVYHLKAFEFNIDGNQINYLTTLPAAVQFKTALPSIDIIETTPSIFCNGTSGDVEILVTDPDNDSTPFDPAHVFTLQLSNSSGSFASPQILTDTVYSEVNSIINLTLPAGITPGTYSLRVVSTLPAVISDTVQFVIPEIPVVNISFIDGVLTSSEPTGNTWYRNNSLIEGATGQSFEMTQPGTFKVMVNVDGCAPVSSNEIVITGTEAGIDFNTRVFPTVALHEVTIETKWKLPATYHLLDVQGRVVKTGTLTRSKTVLNVNDLSRGFYIVRLKTREQLVLKKFIKE